MWCGLGHYGICQVSNQHRAIPLSAAVGFSAPWTAHQTLINVTSPRRPYDADDIFKCIYCERNRILIQIFLKDIPTGLIDNKSTLVLVMAVAPSTTAIIWTNVYRNVWRITRPHWVNSTWQRWRHDADDSMDGILFGRWLNLVKFPYNTWEGFSIWLRDFCR